jgi:hypothetical protein
MQCAYAEPCRYAFSVPWTLPHSDTVHGAQACTNVPEGAKLSSCEPFYFLASNPFGKRKRPFMVKYAIARALLRLAELSHKA